MNIPKYILLILIHAAASGGNVECVRAVLYTKAKIARGGVSPQKTPVRVCARAYVK